MKNKVVDVQMIFDSPNGRYGFRSGYWNVTLSDGTVEKRYGSVPHSIDIDRQKEILIARFNNEVVE